MKKIQFVTQSKGGVGKSVLSFLLAEKYPNAGILDMDGESKTTLGQLAYRKPDLVSFHSSNKTIDRGLFSDFLEETTESKLDHFICDLGASISGQLPEYFRDNTPKQIATLLTAMDLDLELIVVVGGSNIFKATMEYLEDLLKATANCITVKIAANKYFEFDIEQDKILQDVAKKNKLSLHYFNISPDTNISTQDRIKKVLKGGKGYVTAPGFSKIHFQNAIDNLTL